jgi:F0F1-type ATP synthase assembly protein I
MTNDTATGRIQLTRAILKRLLQVSVSTLIQAAILFIASGRFDWMMAWIYVGLIVGVPIVNSLFILPKIRI